eukprot:scaffold179620_cov21-Tisochrysis_lutea.AAC.1
MCLALLNCTQWTRLFTSAVVPTEAQCAPLQQAAPHILLLIVCAQPHPSTAPLKQGAVHTECASLC